MVPRSVGRLGGPILRRKQTENNYHKDEERPLEPRLLMGATWQRHTLAICTHTSPQRVSTVQASHLRCLALPD
ncbi:unnamed protein product [Leptosia nina]|uniref:Uncharacterized protein n=1 Tax=Leptosia nina TaxID=320188 RepID=A0AAV1IUL9_9NEOP